MLLTLESYGSYINSRKTVKNIQKEDCTDYQCYDHLLFTTSTWVIHSYYTIR